MHPVGQPKLSLGDVFLDCRGDSQRVLLADDLLATGGTMKACCDLVEMLGGDLVGITCLIELEFLDGRERLGKFNQNVHSVITY